MIPGQDHKDLVFNESILVIDQFFNNTVTNFVEETPEEIRVGEKFIITGEVRTNQICVLTHESRDIQVITPKAGMVLFLTSQLCFFLFDGEGWVKVTSRSQLPEHFSGINEEHIIQNHVANHYLYLSSHSNITLPATTAPELTIIIKQNYESAFTLTWPDNILWENNAAHVLTSTKNSIDVVKLFSLPETNHFLGKIISQNHKF
jgi:hypothetical protein